MSNSKMLIDATHPEETRVVVQRNGRVEEFDFESAARKLLRGNIYLAKVTRVEPSLQAAFVDYGGNRHGFLAFNEIHPDYYQIPVADRIALLEEQAAAEAELEAAADRRAEALAKRAEARSEKAAKDQGASDSEADEASDESTTPDSDNTSGDDTDVAASASDDDAVKARVSDDSADTTNDDDTDDADDSDDGAHIIDVDDDEDDGHIEVVGGDDEDEDDADNDDDSEESVDRDDDGNVATQSDDDSSEDADEAPARPSRRRSRQVKAKADDTLTEDIDDASEDETAESNDDDVEDEDRGATDSDDSDNDLDDDTENDHDSDEAAANQSARRARRRMRSYKIQEVIKRRQIILVQVVKEERGNKGAALTTYLSLAGRYTVLMPNTARGGGISRKITNPQDRKRLKAIANELDVPEGMGLIIRTAGAARTKQEIRRDFEYLLRLWENVREMTLQSTAPSLVYEEGDLIKRSIRDLYNKDVDEVVVAGDEACQEASDFMQMLMPSHAKNVTAYRDPMPLFNKYGVERQLNAMFQPQVTLRSGGYIVINQTEALVAIDVNSGKSTKEFSIEETALATNLEAAEEIARQLKLRDLAGLVVIDFIDMEEKRNNRAVERRLKDALRFDRARIQLGRISHFGLMEMSRQRLRTGVLEGSTSQCPHCQGTGIIRSTESIALAVLRGIEDAITAGANTPLVATTTPTVALYILNNKRAYISDIESRHGHSITVLGSETMHGANFTVEKGAALVAAPRRPDRTAVNMNWGFDGDSEGDEAPDAQLGNIQVVGDDDGEVSRADGRREEGGRKRRRRRGRGRGRGRGDASDRDDTTEAVDASDAADNDQDASTNDASSKADNDNAENGEDHDASPRSGRRRRRGRRGGRRGRERRAGAADGDAASTDSSEPDSDSDSVDAVASADHAPTTEKSGRGKRLWEQPSSDKVDASAEPGHGAADDICSEIAMAADDMSPSKSEQQTAPVATSEQASEDKPASSTEKPVEIAITENSKTDAVEAVVDTVKPPAPKPQARHETGSAEPRIERVVVRPDMSDMDSSAPTEGEASTTQRKGWWQRRFGGD